MIKLTAIGHCGKDAIVNNVNGKSVINFTVAVTEKFSSAGEAKEKTTWLECAYWSDKTAVAPYLKKGTQVYVEGTPEVKTYPKNDGTTGVSLAVRVVSVQLLGSAQGGAQSQVATPMQAPAAAQPVNTVQQAITGDLPF